MLATNSNQMRKRLIVRNRDQHKKGISSESEKPQKKRIKREE